MAIKSLNIDLDKSPALNGFMMNRGAPRHLLRASFELTVRDLSTARSEADVRPVPPEKQMALLHKSLTKPITGSWWMVIGSELEDKMATACALSIMQSATIKSVRHPHITARPLFHNIYGGRWDKLRDDESYRSNIGRVGLLVIANLPANATPEKIEKATDLLQMYSAVPRVLVVNGIDPLEFAVTRLYKKPSRVLYIRPRSRFHQV